MVFAVETEDVLQAWALPIENNIGVGGFDLALAANPLTSLGPAGIDAIGGDLPCHERSGGRLGGVAHLVWVCLPHLRGIGVRRVAYDRHRGARPP